MNATFQELIKRNLKASADRTKLASEQGNICGSCKSVLAPPGSSVCPSCESKSAPLEKVAGDKKFTKLASAVRYIAANIGDIVDDRPETEKYLTFAAQHQDLLKAASALDNPPNIKGKKGGKQLDEIQAPFPKRKGVQFIQSNAGPKAAGRKNTEDTDRASLAKTNPQTTSGWFSQSRATLGQLFDNFGKTASINEEGELDMSQVPKDQVMALAAASAANHCACESAGTCKYCRLAAKYGGE